MKFSRRYVILTLLLCSVFLYKFQIMDMDNAVLGEFRGGSLNTDTWNSMVADDVNSQEIKLVIDNKEFTSKRYDFYMDDNRNIMVPVSIIRDVLDCSAHLYEDSQLLVEKHNLSATLVLDDTNAVSTGESVSVVSLVLLSYFIFACLPVSLSSPLEYNLSEDSDFVMFVAVTPTP